MLGLNSLAMPEDNFFVNVGARPKKLKGDASALQAALEAKQSCNQWKVPMAPKLYLLSARMLHVWYIPGCSPSARLQGARKKYVPRYS